MTRDQLGKIRIHLATVEEHSDGDWGYVEHVTLLLGHVDALEKLIREAAHHSLYEICPHPSDCDCPPQKALEDLGEDLIRASR